LIGQRRVAMIPLAIRQSRRIPQERGHSRGVTSALRPFGTNWCEAHDERQSPPCRYCPPLGASAGRPRPPGRRISTRDVRAAPEAARQKAREMFRRFPKGAYMTEIESWRVLPGDHIEFTVRRLPSAD
jgi:hypothetical protein